MPRDERFVYTGVRASELEEEQMANPPPVVVFNGMASPGQAELMHRIGLACGLPDIHGFYGYDFEEHEFIKLPDSKVKRVAAPLPPEPKPPRQVDDDDDDGEPDELVDADLDAALREGFDD